VGYNGVVVRTPPQSVKAIFATYCMVLHLLCFGKKIWQKPVFCLKVMLNKVV